jgi:hypothetical protein
LPQICCLFFSLSRTVRTVRLWLTLKASVRCCSSSRCCCCSCCCCWWWLRSVSVRDATAVDAIRTCSSCYVQTMMTVKTTRHWCFLLDLRYGESSLYCRLKKVIKISITKQELAKYNVDAASCHFLALVICHLFPVRLST